MINSLTSFRFIAAFAIFLFHILIGLDFISGLPFIDKLIKHGAVFMTGFFVLSGFVLTHAYRKHDFMDRGCIYKFYIKRFFKIYPVYILATISFSILYSPASTTLAEWFRIIFNDIFLTQAFFEHMFGLGLNGGTWALSVEMFLYFLFPFLLVISNKSSKILWVSFILCSIVTINANFDRGAYIYANPVMRIADFTAGIGFYFIKDKPFFSKNSVHILSIVLLLISWAFLGNRKYMGGHVIFVFMFGTWITCVYHSKSLFYNNKPMIHLGTISYSFYLWQFMAIKIGLSLASYGIIISCTVAFIANYLLSVLSYYYIEEPIRLIAINKLRSPSSLSANTI